MGGGDRHQIGKHQNRYTIKNFFQFHKLLMGASREAGGTASGQREEHEQREAVSLGVLPISVGKNPP